MDVIAFLAAMKLEARPLLRLVGRYVKGTMGPFTCYHFHVSQTRCILVETGMGRERAVAATRALLSLGRPKLIVSLGIAGAPGHGLRVGDLVIGHSVCELRGHELSPPRPITRLSSNARQAAARAAGAFGRRTVSGVVISTGGEQAVELADPEHSAIEMETAAIAGVCAEHNVPLAALRSISDTPEQPIPFRLRELLDSRQQIRTGSLVAAIALRPSLLAPLLRLWRNARLASRVAAAAALAAASEEIRKCCTHA